MKKALDHITAEIKKYRELKELNGDILCSILQQLTGTLFYLEKIRSDYHDKWQNKVNQLIIDGASVSRAENIAHKEIPEMYMLRRIMESSYKVVEAIRSNLSWLKNERNNSG